MYILYINSPVYDFLTAALIEGLTTLARENRWVLVTSARGNYALNRHVWPREMILRNRSRWDLVILGTNADVDVDLFRELDCPARSICVDGSDSSEMTYPPSNFRLYFKRELYKESQDDVLPCPFAIERRWLHRPLARHNYFLSASFGPTNGSRRAVLEFLQSLDLPGVRLGPVPMRPWHQVAGVLRGQCTWSTFRHRRFAVGHNEPFYRMLQQSRLALAMPGEGDDTGRRWEILGCSAVLVAPLSRLVVPHPLLPGEHFLEYRSLDELASGLEWARANPQRVDEIGRLAYRYCLSYHTSTKRAEYVVRAYLDTRG